MAAAGDPFTPDDFALLSEIAIETWRAAVDRDWSVPAGTLEWSCRATAAHTVDAVLMPALNLASPREHAYAPFGLLIPSPDATTSDLVDCLRAVTNVLFGVIATAEPGTRAIIRHRPTIEVAPPADFAPTSMSRVDVGTHDIRACSPDCRYQVEKTTAIAIALKSACATMPGPRRS